MNEGKHFIDKYNGVSELAEGYTYIRGRCKQLGNLYSPNRDDGRCISGADYEIIVAQDDFVSHVDGIEKRSEDICRRISMSTGDTTNNTEDTIKESNDLLSPLASNSERRLSRDIGIQAFSIDFEEPKTVNAIDSSTDPYFTHRDCQSAVSVRRDSCHFHKLVSPSNEVFIAHCSGTSPNLEYRNSIDTFKSHGGANYVEVPTEKYANHKCCYHDQDHYHCRCSLDSNEHGHRYSTCSSDSSIITKVAPDSSFELSRRCSNWKSGLVYYMDPCIEDSTENTADGEYNESEQNKPLLDKVRGYDEHPSILKYEKRNSIKKKSIDEAINRPSNSCVVPIVEGIELANDAVCPFGLAKNLEKQICIIPSRKKKSSGRPSFLKLVTFILIGSAILITSAAIKEAYY